MTTENRTKSINSISQKLTNTVSNKNSIIRTNKQHINNLPIRVLLSKINTLKGKTLTLPNTTNSKNSLTQELHSKSSGTTISSSTIRMITITGSKQITLLKTISTTTSSTIISSSTIRMITTTKSKQITLVNNISSSNTISNTITRVRENNNNSMISNTSNTQVQLNSSSNTTNSILTLVMVDSSSNMITMPILSSSTQILEQPQDISSSTQILAQVAKINSNSKRNTLLLKIPKIL